MQGILGIRISATVATLLLLTGCAVPLPKAGPGLLVTKTTEPIAAGPAEKALKSGEACQHNILGMATIGDASTAAAKRAGKVATIHSVDSQMLGILGLYAQNCVIVSGQ